MKYILFLSFLTGIVAQDNDWDDREHKKGRNHKRSEKIENMIIWRLTDDLDLSTDQAEKFFPRFREHRQELEELGRKEREISGNIRGEMSDDKKITKSDVKKMIEKVSKFRQKRIELESEFVLSMDDILTPSQMIRLGVFKERMMREMRDGMRDEKGKKSKKRKKKGRKKWKYGMRFNDGWAHSNNHNGMRGWRK